MEKGFLLSGQMAKAQYAENKKKMKHPLRSAVTTTGRRMAGARSLWRANGMREEQFGRPVIGIANSFRDTCICTRSDNTSSSGSKRSAVSPRNSTPSPSTTASPWGTTACFIRCPRARSLPTASNIWPTPTRSTHWAASRTATRSPRAC